MATLFTTISWSLWSSFLLTKIVDYQCVVWFQINKKKSLQSGRIEPNLKRDIDRRGRQQQLAKRVCEQGKGKNNGKRREKKSKLPDGQTDSKGEKVREWKKKKVHKEKAEKDSGGWVEKKVVVVASAKKHYTYNRT